MNANGLAKQYDKLKGAERFALIVAAATRGDDTERRRLIESATQTGYSLPDHWGAGTTFERLANFHFMLLLDTAAIYLEALAVALHTKPKKGADPMPRNLWDGVFLAGYRFRVELAGWRMFCGELGVDPEWFWERLPGLATIRRVAQFLDPDPESGNIRGPAFTAEGVARFAAARELGKQDAEWDAETLARFQPITAEDVAAELRFCWGKMREKWD